MLKQEMEIIFKVYKKYFIGKRIQKKVLCESCCFTKKEKEEKICCEHISVVAGNTKAINNNYCVNQVKTLYEITDKKELLKIKISGRKFMEIRFSYYERNDLEINMEIINLSREAKEKAKEVEE